MGDDNLKFWDSVEKTNPAHTKKVSSGGHSFTAIDAYHQIKNATALWGPYGSDWGFQNTTLTVIQTGEDTIALFSGDFKWPEGCFPLCTSIPVRYKTSKGYFKLDGDFAKKAETDAITKALSRLGFNADVFLGRFDDNRYVAEMRKEFSGDKSKEEITIDILKAFISSCKTVKSLNKYYKDNESFIVSLMKAEHDDVLNDFANKKRDLEEMK